MASKIDFFALPRPMQERFAAATRQTAAPMPLLSRRAPRTLVWAYLGASVALAVASAVVMGVGWGDFHSPLAVHGVKMLVVDAALFAAAAYGVLHAVGLLMALEALPFRPGTYLFPACAVEATSPRLRVWPVGEAERIEKVTQPSPGVAVKMKGGETVVVRADSAQDADRAFAAMQTLRGKLMRAIDDGDPHVLADLDPLHDGALSSPIGPTEAMKEAVQIWTRLDWAIAAAIGTLLALVLVTMRNAISDDAMYRAVVADGTPAAFQAYLAHGRLHRKEVEDVLLPRAELVDAQAQGTVAALRDFARQHPDSQIQTELEAAMRRVLLVELSKAQKEGTVAALDAFAQAYPEPLVNAEWASARHALYAQAYASWRKSVSPDAATAAFMERLLAWSEKNGPACEARFELTPLASLDDADAGVRKSGHFPGNDALPSNFLTADAFAQRQQRLIDDWVKGFAGAFPADILSLAPAGKSDAPSGKALPSLAVTYTADWSRATSACLKPDTAFAGFIFTFEAAFSIPDGKPPLSLTAKAWRGPEAWKIRPDDKTRPEFEQKVYDMMIDGAFDQLDKRLAHVLF